MYMTMADTLVAPPLMNEMLSQLDVVVAVVVIGRVVGLLCG